MASAAGSSSQASDARAPAGAPPADNVHAHLAAGQPGVNVVNPEFVAMPAAQPVARLHRHRRAADFADAAAVLADRERRLADAEALIRLGDDRIGRLREGITWRDDQLRQAAETEQGLRDEIRALRAEARVQQRQQQRRAAADADEARVLRQQPRARTRRGSSSRGVRHDDAGADAMPAARGEVGGNVRAPTGYRTLRMRPEDPLAFDTAGVQTRLAEGKVGDGTPRTTGYKSMRMNASASPSGFRGCSQQAAKQPRRRS